MSTGKSVCEPRKIIEYWEVQALRISQVFSTSVGQRLTLKKLGKRNTPNDRNKTEQHRNAWEKQMWKDQIVGGSIKKEIVSKRYFISKMCIKLKALVR